jgi:hypothetical protein
LPSIPVSVHRAIHRVGSQTLEVNLELPASSRIQLARLSLHTMAFDLQSVGEIADVLSLEDVCTRLIEGDIGRIELELRFLDYNSPDNLSSRCGLCLGSCASLAAVPSSVVGPPPAVVPPPPECSPLFALEPVPLKPPHVANIKIRIPRTATNKMRCIVCPPPLSPYTAVNGQPSSLDLAPTAVATVTIEIACPRSQGCSPTLVEGAFSEVRMYGVSRKVWEPHEKGRSPVLWGPRPGKGGPVLGSRPH